MYATDSLTGLKERVFMFIWQHLLLTVSMFVMTLGVALCVRSDLGSSVISSIPFVMSLAGDASMAPSLTIGEYTYIMNCVLVALQVVVLGRRFELVQLFQLVIGFLFGFLLDLNMWLTSALSEPGLGTGVAVQLGGCVLLATGISMEIRCGSVTMPGEGITAALSRRFGKPFAKMKIWVDTSLVVTAVVLGYLYFGTWLWQVIGLGTLMAMVLVGLLVKAIDPHMLWFDKLLHSGGGVPRYVVGLARFIYRRKGH